MAMRQRAVTLFLLAVSAAGTVLAAEEFAGTTWYHSGDPKGLLQVTAEGKLLWHPKKPHQLTARIPKQRIDRPGDVVEFAVKWTSDGRSRCKCANQKHFRGDFCKKEKRTPGLRGRVDEMPPPWWRGVCFGK